MNSLISLLVVAVVVGTACARIGGQPNPDNQATGYGEGSGSGYGRRPQYYYPPPPPPRKDDMPLTELDQLKARFNNVLDQLKTAGEIVEALSAQLSLQKSFVDQLNFVTLVQLEQTDNSQDTIIVQLDTKIDTLMNETSALNEEIEALRNTNDELLDQQTDLLKQFADVRDVDIGQSRSIARLDTLVQDLKDKLFQVKNNAFEDFADDVEVEAQLVAAIRASVARRKCEAGQVTLDADDRRVEYQFKSSFDSMPSVLYGLCGYNFNIDSRSTPAYGYGYGYNKEPHSIGIRASLYTTLTGLSVELFDTGFGESSVVTGTVCFQACSVTPV